MTLTDRNLRGLSALADLPALVSVVLNGAAIDDLGSLGQLRRLTLLSLVKVVTGSTTDDFAWLAPVSDLRPLARSPGDPTSWATGVFQRLQGAGSQCGVVVVVVVVVVLVGAVAGAAVGGFVIGAIGAFGSTVAADGAEGSWAGGLLPQARTERRTEAAPMARGVFIPVSRRSMRQGSTSWMLRGHAGEEPEGEGASRRRARRSPRAHPRRPRLPGIRCTACARTTQRARASAFPPSRLLKDHP